MLTALPITFRTTEGAFDFLHPDLDSATQNDDEDEHSSGASMISHRSLLIECDDLASRGNPGKTRLGGNHHFHG